MAVSILSRRIVRERAQLRCEYCHADERWQFIRFTIDHIRPQSDGGSDEVDNLALVVSQLNFEEFQFVMPAQAGIQESQAAAWG